MSDKYNEPENDLEVQESNNSSYVESGYEKESVEEMKVQLEQEKEKVTSYEKKIQYLMADFENIKKRSDIDVQNRVNSITDGILLKFLGMYDDFIRARDALSKQGSDIQGLDAILKNMNTFLMEFGVKPIEAVGEIFDPKLHEAISIKKDPELNDDVITSEIRKGYILKDRVIRPSLVEISKKF